MSAAEFKAIGNSHLQNKEFDQAIEAYTKAIEIDPTDHVFYSNRSAAYLSKGEGNGALKDALKCVELKPDWPKGFARKGAALHSLKRYEEAGRAYEAGLKVDPNDAGCQSGLAEIKKIQAPPPASSGKSFLPPALLAKLAGHPKFGPKLADPMFQAKLSMLQSNPQMMMQDPEIMEIFGALMEQDGGGDNNADSSSNSKPPAQSSSSSSSSNAPPKPTEKPVETDPATQAKDRGNELYKAKKFDEAIAAYDEAIALDESKYMFRSNKAAVYIELGDCDRAVEICQEAIKIARNLRAPYEDVAKLFQREGAAYTKKGDLVAAIKSYENAQLENFDKSIDRKVKLLQLDLKKKNIEDYINPELGAEAKDRGNAAFREGKFAEAIKEYEDAVKRDPTNAAIRNNLAATLLKVGDFNGAKKNVEKSLELDPKYVKAWAKKGDIEFFMKEYHKALDSYRAGLQIEPDNSLCKQGLTKTMQVVNSSQYGEVDKERQAHAMADPEIQMILQDPMMRQTLQDMQTNPELAQRAMNNPVVRAKIDKLIAAGVLQIK